MFCHLAYKGKVKDPRYMQSKKDSRISKLLTQIYLYQWHLLDSIFWSKVLGQWSSHQLPSNVRWGCKMSFPLLFRRSRHIFVQFHGESGSWYDSEIKKPVSVWSCLCNLVRDCNSLSLFTRQCKSWWGTIFVKKWFRNNWMAKICQN